MLYILECMSLIFLSLNGKYDEPLHTTGQVASAKEAIICFVCWLIVSILITSIILFIKHLKTKKSAKSKSKDHEEDFNSITTNIERNKFLRYLSYFLECMRLCFYPLYSEENKIMHSTGEKPTKKEITICVLGWLLIAALIILVILICI